MKTEARAVSSVDHVYMDIKSSATIGFIRAGEESWRRWRRWRWPISTPQTLAAAAAAAVMAVKQSAALPPPSPTGNLRSALVNVTGAGTQPLVNVSASSPSRRRFTRVLCRARGLLYALNVPSSWPPPGAPYEYIITGRLNVMDLTLSEA